ncbi:hypothetical protein M153_4630005688 [Pseudoloma neurophilia]|uniref:Uncharacterized protein n=1 Tax=Pseudoloma neurophilia TaxID=146866 RepID=A0A0R0LXB9_9MICR|nr:hypothetical protein M153_4630005688 [Pseudoloma neurophilia]
MFDLKPLNVIETDPGIEKEKIVLKQVFENSIKEMKGHIMSYKLNFSENTQFHNVLKQEYLKKWIFHGKILGLEEKDDNFMFSFDKSNGIFSTINKLSTIEESVLDVVSTLQSMHYSSLIHRNDSVSDHEIDQSFSLNNSIIEASIFDDEIVQKRNQTENQTIIRTDQDIPLDTNDKSKTHFTIKIEPEEMEIVKGVANATAGNKNCVKSHAEIESKQNLEIIYTDRDLLHILIDQMLIEKRWLIAKRLLKKSKNFNSLPYLEIRKKFKRLMKKYG